MSDTETHRAPELDVQGYVHDVIALIAERAPADAIEESILDIYSTLREQVRSRQTAMELLAELHTIYSDSPISLADLWREVFAASHGIHIEESDSSGEPVFTERSEVILQLAKLHSGGNPKQVFSDAIAAELRTAGDDTPPRSLAIAIGNVLNRARWRRVRTGMYEAPFDESTIPMEAPPEGMFTKRD